MKLAHICGLGIAALLAANALADINPILVSETPGGTVGTEVYTYQLDLSSSGTAEQAVAGNAVFCMSDLGGFVSAATTTSGFSVSEDTTGCSIGAGTTGYPNTGEAVIVKYTSGPTLTSSSNPIDTFTITSTVLPSAIGLVPYGANAQLVTGLPSSNFGEVNGPAAVPEPVTTSILGGAFLLMGLVVRRRSAKKA